MAIALHEPLTERVATRLHELQWPLRAAALLRQRRVRAWLVGGFVRDLALGRAPRDLDVVVDADPLAAGRELAEALEGHVVPLDTERGIVRVALPESATLDLSAMRGGGIEADLRERDFTIDAIALPFAASEGEAIDPFGGLADLGRRRLRLVSDSAFRDDGLRLLRAARLATGLDLSFDPGLLAQAQTDAARALDASPERQRDELARICATDHAARGLRMLDRMGVLPLVLPELTPCRGVSQPKEHYYDVFDHSVETVGALDCLLSRSIPLGRLAERMRTEFWERLDSVIDVRAYFDAQPVAGRSRAALTKLGALLHDIAKPETKAPDDTGRVRFIGHAGQGATRAAAILTRLRFSNREIAFVRTLVEEHLRPTQLSSGAAPPTDRALARYFRDLGDTATAALVLSIADHMAARGPKLDGRDFSAHLLYSAYVLDRRRRTLAAAPPQHLVSGDDLMAELHLPPGPLIGRLLRAVEEAQGAGEIRTREEAMNVAHAALATCH